MRGKLVIAIKEREDKPSQLNRLGTALNTWHIISVGAQSSVLLLSHTGSYDLLTTLLIPVSGSNFSF